MVNSSISVDQLVAETTWLHRVAIALVKDEAAADDLIQDRYIAAATDVPTDGRPLRPWLVRVLWNRVKMRTRGSTRRAARESKFGKLATPPARPDEIVERIEMHRLLAGLVLELPQPQRDVLLLRFFEGLSSSQIGNRLGISAGTVRWRLKSAVDELRDRLEEKKPNRAWVGPLIALARKQTATVATSSVFLIAAAVMVLALAGLLFHLVGNHAEAASSHNKRSTHEQADKVAAMAGAANGPGGGGGGPELVRTDGSLGADHRRRHGTVTDANGTLVEGAEVKFDCEYRSGKPLPTERTNEHGEFAFDTDHECNFVMTATKGNARGTSSSTAHFGDGPIDIRLRNISRGVVRVLDDETGAPIANATVTSRELFGELQTVTTGNDGIARFDLAISAWVRVDATDYVQLQHGLNPTKGAAPGDYGVVFDPTAHVENVSEARLELRLHRGVILAGTILGPDNAPVPARVHVTGTTDFSETNADANGHFEITVARGGRYRLYADSDALVIAKEQVLDVAANGLDNVVAHLAARPEIHGTVVDSHFNPVAGVKVSIADGSTQPVLSDDKGHFSIMADGDMPVDVIARLGAQSSAYQHVAVEYGKQTELTLQIGPGGISGVAVERSGAPVPGATVWLNPCCAGNPRLVMPTSAVADGNGAFTFDVPRGDFVLSVKRDNDDDYLDEDDVKVAGGSRDLKIVVP